MNKKKHTSTTRPASRLARIKSSLRYTIASGKRSPVAGSIRGTNFFLGDGPVAAPAAVPSVAGTEVSTSIASDSFSVAAGAESGREEKMGEAMSVWPVLAANLGVLTHA